MVDERPVIVVADDDDDIRRLLERRLARRGWAPVGARDGAEALGLVRAHAPAAVVLDRSMPRMDGVAALAAVRADPATAGLPVVVLSAHGADDADDVAAADARLGKPFDVDELDALLRRLTGRGDGHAPASTP